MGGGGRGKGEVRGGRWDVEVSRSRRAGVAEEVLKEVFVRGDGGAERQTERVVQTEGV